MIANYNHNLGQNYRIICINCGTIYLHKYRCCPKCLLPIGQFVAGRPMAADEVVWPLQYNPIYQNCQLEPQTENCDFEQIETEEKPIKRKNKKMKLIYMLLIILAMAIMIAFSLHSSACEPPGASSGAGSSDSGQSGSDSGAAAASGSGGSAAGSAAAAAASSGESPDNPNEYLLPDSDFADSYSEHFHGRHLIFDRFQWWKHSRRHNGVWK